MKLLFLDFDGVMNDHTKLPSGYSGIQHDKVPHLNKILDSVPDVQIVVSSAWRYHILNGEMTLTGFMGMLLVHGIKCRDRLYGHTKADGELIQDEPGNFDVEAWSRAGLKWRASQIQDFITEFMRTEGHFPEFAVLDDLPIDVGHLVQTDPAIGITEEHADRVIAILQGAP